MDVLAMTTKVVGFQGEPGAYSEEAIVQHYHREAEPVPYDPTTLKGPSSLAFL